MEGRWWLMLGAVLGNGRGCQASVCTGSTPWGYAHPVPIPGDLCSPLSLKLQTCPEGPASVYGGREGALGEAREKGRGAERMKRDV